MDHLSPRISLVFVFLGPKKWMNSSNLQHFALIRSLKVGQCHESQQTKKTNNDIIGSCDNFFASYHFGFRLCPIWLKYQILFDPSHSM